MLGGRDVQVQGLVEQLDGLLSVAALAPLDEGLQVDEVGVLLAGAAVVGLVDLVNELKLLLSVIMLVLPDSAVDHAYQGCHVALVHRYSLLISGVGILVVTLDLLLVADLRVEAGVLGLQADC